MSTQKPSPVPYSSIWLWNYYKRKRRNQFLSFLPVSCEDDWSFGDPSEESSSEEGMDWLDTSLMQIDYDDRNKDEAQPSNGNIESLRCVGEQVSDSSNSDVESASLSEEDLEYCNGKAQSEQETDEESGSADETVIKVCEMKNRQCVVFLNSSLNSMNPEICLHSGNVVVTCLMGSVTLNGFELKESNSVNVFTGIGTKRCNFVSVSRCQTVNTDKKDIKQRLKKAQLRSEVVEEVMKSLESDTLDVAVLYLKKLESPSIMVLESLSRDVAMWENSWFRFDCLRKRIPMNRIWEEKLTESILPRIKSNSVILACGPKNVGKSSVLRWLVNSALSNGHKEIYFVDCDPGQSEFTTPGVLGFTFVDQPILMPPFISIQLFKNKTFYSTSVAGVSVADNPDLYLTNFRQLWEQTVNFLDFAGTKPIFINTMGWMKSIGQQLLVDIINTVRPTDVIELTSESERNKKSFAPLTPHNVSEMQCWSTGTPMFASDEEVELNYNYMRLDLPKGREPKSSGEAANNRNYSQLSYISLCEELMFKAFTDLRPHQYKLSDVFIHIAYGCPVDKYLATETLRNSWVHLCRVCEQLPETEEMESVHVLAELNENMCLGCGIIRNVNESYVEVISCEAPDKLNLVNCIVKPAGLLIPEQLTV